MMLGLGRRRWSLDALGGGTLVVMEEGFPLVRQSG